MIDLKVGIDCWVDKKQQLDLKYAMNNVLTHEVLSDLAKKNFIMEGSVTGLFKDTRQVLN